MANDTTGISESAKQKLAAAMGGNAAQTSDAKAPESTEEGVVSIVEDATGISREEISPKSSLDEDLSVDSLTLVDIAVRLEEEFNVEIEDEAINKIATVGQLVKLVEMRIS